MGVDRVFYTDNPKSLGLVKNSHRLIKLTVIAQNSKLTIQNYSFTLNSIFYLKFFSPLFRVFWLLFIVADGCFAIFFLATVNLTHCCRQAYPQATHYCRQQTSYPLLQTADKLPIVAENCYRSSGFLGLLQLS